MSTAPNNPVTVNPPVVPMGGQLTIQCKVNPGDVTIRPLSAREAEGGSPTLMVISECEFKKDDSSQLYSYTIAALSLPPGTYWVAPGGEGVSDAIFAVEQAKATADVYLQRSSGESTPEQAIWHAIRKHTEAVGFDAYNAFIQRVFSPAADLEKSGLKGMGLHTSEAGRIGQLTLANHLRGPSGFALLKLATEAFLAANAGLTGVNLETGPGDAARMPNRDLEHPDQLAASLEEALRPLVSSNTSGLPYLQHIARTLATGSTDWDRSLTAGLVKYRLQYPSLLELIWTYWHEESMLAQTTAVLALRFQNASHECTNRLREFELDPLRPLSNLFWGLIQDESNFGDKVFRRAHEYAHQYGLRLIGRAVDGIEPVDDRPKFLEAFHNLLTKATQFYREDADTTVVADAFPLLSALRDVHMVLAEGAHNQFGDMAWTSRVDMLTQQWLLARPEMREFHRGRYMVRYQEDWMGTVDSMRKLQYWGDVSVSHFNQLACDAERIVLSVRYGDWTNREFFEDQARNWVRYWKPEIQRYIHSYQAVTGVDLSVDVGDVRDAARRYAQPSVLLQERLMAQRPAPRRARQASTSLPRAAWPAVARQSPREMLTAARVPLRALRFESGD